MDTDFIIEEIRNEKGEIVDLANHPQEKLKIKIPFSVCKNDIIRVCISWQNCTFIVTCIPSKGEIHNEKERNIFNQWRL